MALQRDRCHPCRVFTLVLKLAEPVGRRLRIATRDSLCATFAIQSSRSAAGTRSV